MNLLKKTQSKKRATSSSVNSIVDQEFGEIKVRRFANTRTIRIKLHANGRLTASLPKRAALYHLRHLLDDSRASLRGQRTRLLDKQPVYTDKQAIGHSHKLAVKFAATQTTASARINKQTITVTLPSNWQNEPESAQDFLRIWVTKALKREARSYLPRRLAYLARELDFKYSKVRFGNAKGRWGSYSATGTISLNVALMQLPLELIDYVLIHELCHSVHAHHQTDFWQAVAACDPSYLQHRQQLKNYSPYL